MVANAAGSAGCVNAAGSAGCVKKMKNPQAG